MKVKFIFEQSWLVLKQKNTPTRLGRNAFAIKSVFQLLTK